MASGFGLAADCRLLMDSQDGMENTNAEQGVGGQATAR